MLCHKHDITLKSMILELIVKILIFLNFKYYPNLILNMHHSNITYLLYFKATYFYEPLKGYLYHSKIFQC
jgi:hypothetical protein